jgi:fructose-bisphosphate aldolase class II
MGACSLSGMLARALDGHYGIAAINVVNDLTMEAVLAAAVEERSPVIVQTSVKTVRQVGVRVLYAQWAAMTAGIEVPVALHLDHCADRAVITECLNAGWNSVLFDASSLPVEENQRQTVEVVAEARRHGASVEGEIESITGVEDDHGSEEEAPRQSLDVVTRFLEVTGVDVFAPSIGNAHGSYRQEPELDMERVSAVAALGVPVALHGGSGLTEDQFRELVERGCAKVNLSTVLKETFMEASLGSLRIAEQTQRWDPLSLFTDARSAVLKMTQTHMRCFGSSGKAW